MKKFLDQNYLCNDEKIITRLEFTKVPIIILWGLTLIISIIAMSISALDGFWISILICIVIALILCGIFTAQYLSREVFITNKRIIFRCGLLTLRYLEISLEKVQSARAVQRFWQRLFNYGTLVVSNGTFGIIGYRFNGVIDLEQKSKILSETIVQASLNKEKTVCATN